MSDEVEFLHRFKQTLSENVGEFIPYLYMITPSTMIDWMKKQRFILTHSELNADDVILSLTFIDEATEEIKVQVEFVLMYGLVKLRKMEG